MEDIPKQGQDHPVISNEAKCSTARPNRQGWSQNSGSRL